MDRIDKLWVALIIIVLLLLVVNSATESQGGEITDYGEESITESSIPDGFLDADEPERLYLDGHIFERCLDSTAIYDSCYRFVKDSVFPSWREVGGDSVTGRAIDFGSLKSRYRKASAKAAGDTGLDPDGVDYNLIKPAPDRPEMNWDKWVELKNNKEAK